LTNDSVLHLLLLATSYQGNGDKGGICLKRFRFWCVSEHGGKKVAFHCTICWGTQSSHHYVPSTLESEKREKPSRERPTLDEGSHSSTFTRDLNIIRIYSSHYHKGEQEQDLALLAQKRKERGGDKQSRKGRRTKKNIETVRGPHRQEKVQSVGYRKKS